MDNADNVKGVPGLGIKAVEKLFSTLEDKLVSFRNCVLNAYCDNFGESLGIEEFYKNYQVLKIKDKYEGLIFKDPIKFELKVKEEDSEYKEEDSW